MDNGRKDLPELDITWLRPSPAHPNLPTLDEMVDIIMNDPNLPPELRKPFAAFFRAVVEEHRGT